jgi:hypothetical protein
VLKLCLRQDAFRSEDLGDVIPVGTQVSPYPPGQIRACATNALGCGSAWKKDPV